MTGAARVFLLAAAMSVAALAARAQGCGDCPRPAATPPFERASLVPETRALLDARYAARPPNRASEAPNGATAPRLLFARTERATETIGGAGLPGRRLRATTDGGRLTAQGTSADPWWVPLASAALPGAGQARLHQDRFVGYLAVEGFLWLQYVTDRREGLRQRDAYRDVALRVSRAAFGGSKPPGDFEYYERMEHWVASGSFDTDPSTPALDPESDTTTFNGAMWLLARRTYWTRPDLPPAPGSPASVAALAFYEQAAVRPDFQWSWRNSRLEQDIYQRHIKESNDAFRQAVNDIGVVIANHVLSTVDAYISLRLRMRAQPQPGGQSSVGISATLPVALLGEAPQ